jgi:flagellar M-ring protein FliF
VTVVDQNGNMLSSSETPTASNTMDPSQLRYVKDLQESIVKRIESILTPMMGPGNVRAEASAEVDFSHVEQAAESYKPNAAPDATTIRSQRNNESNSTEPGKAAGLVGASSNQPAAGGASTASAPVNSQKDNTINYEVDKTVRYSQQSTSNIKRLTVAVLLNHKREVDAEGKVKLRALTDDEKTQVADLVKEAMGYNKERGDSLNVTNSAFAEVPTEVIPEQPIWKPYANIETAKSVGQFAVSAGMLLYLFFGFLKPLFKRATSVPVAAPALASAGGAPVQNASDPAPRPTVSGYAEDLQSAKQMATQEPKVVANVVKNWVNGNE